jgi:hypothetical protein
MRPADCSTYLAMNYFRSYANFESVIVGLLLLAFVVGLAHFSHGSVERETPIGVRAAEASSPAIGE